MGGIHFHADLSGNNFSWNYWNGAANSSNALKKPKLLMPHSRLIGFQDDDPTKMEMDPNGAKLLSELPGPLHVIAFTGKGRTGKSTLGSHALGHKDLFPSADTKDAVTFGVHAAAIAHPTSHGSLVVLDCEGTDNPTAPSRRAELVSTLALLVSNAVVNLCWDRIDDTTIECLAKLVAGKELIKHTDSDKAPPLLILVNAVRKGFKYEPHDLEDILTQTDESARGCNRSAVKDYFGDRSVITVPDMDRDPDGFMSGVFRLSEFVMSASKEQMVGSMLARTLPAYIEKLNNGEVVEPKGQYEFVITQWLRDLAESKYQAYLEKMGPLDKYQPALPKASEVMQEFDASATPYMKKTLMKAYQEVRCDLDERLQNKFNEFERRNNDLGRARVEAVANEAINKYKDSLDKLLGKHEPDEQKHAPDASNVKEQLKDISAKLVDDKVVAMMEVMRAHFSSWQKQNCIKGSPEVMKIVETLLQEYSQLLPAQFVVNTAQYRPQSGEASDQLHFGGFSHVLKEQGIQAIKTRRQEAFNNWETQNSSRGQEIDEVLDVLNSWSESAGEHEVQTRTRTKGDKAAGTGFGLGALGAGIGGLVGGPLGAVAGAAIGGGGGIAGANLGCEDDYGKVRKEKKIFWQKVRVRRKNGNVEEIARTI